MRRHPLSGSGRPLPAALREPGFRQQKGAAMLTAEHEARSLSRHEPPRSRGAPLRGAEDAPEELLGTFQSVLVAGRWLLMGAETAATGLLMATADLGPGAIPALALLFGYNALSLVVVHRIPIRRVPVPWLLALDVLFLAVAAHHTGGSGSPFLGQYYLIILAAALFYGLAGGLVLGTVSALASAVLVPLSPTGSWGELWQDLRNLAVYYVIIGGFTGYLVDRLRTWFARYQESQAEIRKQELQAEVAHRELELARAMQNASLPAIPPRVPGLDIEARLEFAREVGGDFYLFLMEGERVGLVVGDVSGKGVPAALISTTVAHLLPTLQPLKDPALALRRLNQDLTQRLPTNAFVSLVLAEVDTGAGSLRTWSAGHPPALLWRAGEGRVVQAEGHNPLLGIFPEYHCHPEDWPLETGDVLLLYSDGLIEASNAQDEQYGVERAAEVLRQNTNRSAEGIADALVSAVRQWGDLSDDLTLLICKRVAERPPPRGSLEHSISRARPEGRPRP